METSHEVVTEVKAKNVKVVRKGETMRDILDLVSTEYILLADDLDVVTNWTNIERGVSIVKTKEESREAKMIVTRSGSTALAGWACRQWAGL